MTKRVLHKRLHHWQVLRPQFLCSSLQVLILGSLAATADGQIFIRESTWGFIDPPAVEFAGLVEVVSALLLLQVSMLIFTFRMTLLKWRLGRRVPGLAKKLDHMTARKELRQKISKGSTILSWTTYLLAPISGLAGIVLGSPFMIGPIDLALIMVLVAIFLLCLGGMILSRIKQLVLLVP